MKKEFYTVAEIKELFHITNTTLFRWRESGKLKAIKVSERKFVFPKTEIDKLLGLEEEKPQRKNVVYCRVSTYNQKSHLEKQAQLLNDYCTANGITVDETIREIASGMNDARKGLQKLLTWVLNEEVDTVFVSYKDRLTRFGFDHYKWLFEQYKTKIVVVNNPIDQEAIEQEMTDDLISIIHQFSMKMYSGRRQQLKKCREALKGSAPDGEEENTTIEGNNHEDAPRKKGRPRKRG